MGDALKRKLYQAVLDLVEQDLRVNQAHSESLSCCPLDAVDEMGDGISVRIDGINRLDMTQLVIDTAACKDLPDMWWELQSPGGQPVLYLHVPYPKTQQPQMRRAAQPGRPRRMRGSASFSSTKLLFYIMALLCVAVFALAKKALLGW